MKRILLVFACLMASIMMVNAAEIGGSPVLASNVNQLFKKKNVDPDQPKDSTNWQKYWKLTGVIGKP